MKSPVIEFLTPALPYCLWPFEISLSTGSLSNLFLSFPFQIKIGHCGHTQAQI